MSLAIHDTKSPRYIQVYGLLKDWIQKGHYAPNEKLPSEGELCKMFGVSRITTRRAIEMLSTDGLLRRVQGLGTFVPPTIPKPVEAFGNISELTDRVKRFSERTRLSEIDISEVDPDPTAAAELQLKETQKVIRASYIRLEKDTAVACAELFVPSDLGIKLTATDLRRNSSPTMLQDKGVKILGAHQLIGATLSDSTLSNRLRVTVGSPLIRIRFLLLGERKKPIEYRLAYYRADAYEHHSYLTSF